MFILVSLLYTVFPLAIPKGMTVEYTPQVNDKRHTTSLGPSELMQMNQTELIAIAVTLPSSSITNSKPEKILIYRGNKLLSVLDRPTDSELSDISHFDKAPIDALGHYIYPKDIISKITLSQSGKIYATIQNPFDGAYSGITRWPLVNNSGKWVDSLSNTGYTTRYNSSITATENGDSLAILQDYENATDYVSQDAQYGRIDADEMYVANNSKVSYIGKGEIYDAKNGYFVGSLFRYYPAITESGAQTTSFIWKNDLLKVLGRGIVWSVNSSGIAVGDDRPTINRPGYPTAWYSGKKIRLSTSSGTASSVNDRGEIVGTLTLKGAFLAHIDKNHVVLKRIDNLLNATSNKWHIEQSVAVANNGSILALARDPIGLRKIVILKPKQ